MRRIGPFRIASALLIVFFFGHTFGGMSGRRSFGPASDAVLAAMKTVRFDFNGSSVTWYGFWLGFGLTVSVYLLLAAVVAWQLERVPPASWSLVSVIAWSLVGAMGGTAALSFAYFFAGPGVIATLVTVLLAIGAVRKARAAA
jgi:hypothetical protein